MRRQVSMLYIFLILCGHSLCGIESSVVESQKIAHALASKSVNLGSVKVDYSHITTPGDFCVEFHRSIGSIREGQSEAEFLKGFSSGYEYSFVTNGHIYKFTRKEATGYETNDYRSVKQVNFDGNVFGLYDAHQSESGELVDGLASVSRDYTPMGVLFPDFYNHIPLGAGFEVSGWLSLKDLHTMILNADTDDVSILKNGGEIQVILVLRALNSYTGNLPGVNNALRLTLTNQFPYSLKVSEALFVSYDQDGSIILSEPRLRCTYRYSDFGDLPKVFAGVSIDIFYPKNDIIGKKIVRADDFVFGHERTIRIDIDSIEPVLGDVSQIIGIDLPIGTRLLDQVTNEVYTIGGIESNIEELGNEFDN